MGQHDYPLLRELYFVFPFCTFGIRHLRKDSWTLGQSFFVRICRFRSFVSNMGGAIIISYVILILF